MERSEITEKNLDDLYDALAEEVLGDVQIILSQLIEDGKVGETFVLVPLMETYEKRVGQHVTITKLVEDELDDLEDEASGHGLDDEFVVYIDGFAAELESCAAKIREFLTKHATEEVGQ